MSSIIINIRFVTSPRVRIIFTALVFVVCCIASQNTFATTFTVTRNDDRNATCDSGTDCSLREAVVAANTAATDDTINFAAGLSHITLASGDTGDISITSNGTLKIQGPGANVLTIDGGAAINRIFGIDAATVTVSGVTLQNGNGAGTLNTGLGGAILIKNGTLVLDSVVVQNNGASAVSGGGVVFFNGTNHRIINSTFSGNSSDQCGAIYNITGTLAMANTTISGNTAAFDGEGGGAICNGGGLNIRNSTIANNSATAANGSGGGILNFGTVDIGNTIVAGNIAVAQPEIRNKSTVISSGNNLVGDSAGDSSDTLNSITYKTAAGTEDILDTPPLLGALQNNGGSTPTRALLTGSPAIDKGNNNLAFDLFTMLANDQRGQARTVDGDGNGSVIVDIGAVEFIPTGTTAADVTVSGYVKTIDRRGIKNVVVTMTDTDGKALTAITNETGYFQFAVAKAGETYVFGVIAKHYQFSQPVQIRAINGDIDDISFVAVKSFMRTL